MPPSDPMQFFTVYLTKDGIELKSGCQDYPNHQAIHTSRSYDSAYDFAKTAATHRNLPLKNWFQVNRKAVFSFL